MKNWNTVKISSYGLQDQLNKIPTTSGWYMIYTNVPIYELETLKRLKNSSAIDIKKRVVNAKLFCSEFIIKENTDKKYCVYIGHQVNLRRRIKEHFCGAKRTGCLSLFKHQKLKKYQWEVLYFDFNKMDGLENCNLTRTIFENNIRREFGWPILCAK